MLKSLAIRNFRVFDELTVEQLGRVNLVVGRNNSGKTCLLEALEVYGQRARAEVLDGLLRARNEDLEELNQGDLSYRQSEDDAPRAPDAATHRFRNLFHGYRFPDSPDDMIKIGPARNGASTLRISFVPKNARPGEMDRLVHWASSETDNPLWRVLVEHVIPAPHLLVEEEDERGTHILKRHWLRKMPSVFVHEPEDRKTHNAARAAVNFAPARGLDPERVTHLWERVLLRPRLREHVIRALQIIEPRIAELVMIRGNRDVPVPVLLYRDDTRLPLDSLGDGATHLFHLILSTVTANGGLVLFDELENGLHWSVQPLVWRTLFELAVELDLQLFASTHSWDCVRAFKDIACEHRASARLLHLGRSVRTSAKGAIQVTEYDKDTLALATQSGLELR